MRKIWQFINRYPPTALIRSLSFLLEAIIRNAQSGSQIVVAATVVPFLLLAIALLYLANAVKWISTNFFNLMKSLFTICIIEVRFYWEKMREVGEVLAEELSELISRMFQFILYLLSKLVDDNAEYGNHGNHTSVLVILRRFITWLFYALVTILMSAFLIITFFTGLPLLHQYLRQLLMGNINS
ncbi:hypothetical protein [Halotia branconii]|uniref:Uncharacterized protein n=1 Tax=Halotia branconii CENA392 TaxID=1539056 RepID=A0AAJ6PAE7_9CYAN|nr:hypothetical protein [Halotia branconii]WGV26715.1 hypothetical protein QI031_04190 [Halotia branconii CENA392]